MDPILIIYLLALVFLLYLSARFSGSETALTALSKVDIAQMRLDKEKNAEIIAKLKSDMDRTIITILIGNNLVNVTASAIATKITYDIFGNIGISLAIGGVTILLLIFGEISPKGFAINNKKNYSRRNAKMIYYLSIIWKPLIDALEWVSDALIKLMGGETEGDEIHISESDIRHLASIMEEEGVIKEIEKDILHRVFWFGDLKVDSVKIPRSESFVLDSKVSIDEGVEFIKEHGFTRMPVARHGTNKIIGILYSKDLLGEEKGDVKEYIREVPLYVGNEDDITEVFKTMRKERIHMAIVLDNESKFDGIITLEDALEELLGEIYDEFDQPE
ncbi:MAG: hemolysin family protein [Thermoplasmata archaeon]